MVEQARRIPGFLGARLCGGGFGGAAVLLAEAECYEEASSALAEACRVQFGADCFLQAVRPSSSARLFAGTSPESE